MEKEQIKNKMVDTEDNDDLEEFVNLDDEYNEILDKIADHCSQQNREKVKQFLENKNDEFEPHNKLKT